MKHVKDFEACETENCMMLFWKLWILSNVTMKEKEEEQFIRVFAIVILDPDSSCDNQPKPVIERFILNCRRLIAT